MSTSLEVSTPTTEASGLPTPIFPAKVDAPLAAIEPPVPTLATPPPHDSTPTSPAQPTSPRPSDKDMEEMAALARRVNTMTPVKEARGPLTTSGQKCPVPPPPFVSDIIMTDAEITEMARALDGSLTKATYPDEEFAGVWDDSPSGSSLESDASDDEAARRLEDAQVREEEEEQEEEEEEEEKPVAKAPAPVLTEVQRMHQEMLRLQREVAALKSAAATAAPPASLTTSGKSPVPAPRVPTGPRPDAHKYVVKADVLIPTSTNASCAAATVVAAQAEKYGARARQQYESLVSDNRDGLLKKCHAMKQWAETRHGNKPVFNAAERRVLNTFAESWEIYGLLKAFAFALTRSRVEMTEHTMRKFTEFIFSNPNSDNPAIPAMSLSTLFDVTTNVDNIMIGVDDMGLDVETRVKKTHKSKSGAILGKTVDLRLKIPDYLEMMVDTYDCARSDRFTTVNHEKKVLGSKDDEIYSRDESGKLTVQSAFRLLGDLGEEDIRVMEAAEAPKKRKSPAAAEEEAEEDAIIAEAFDAAVGGATELTEPAAKKAKLE